MTQTTAQFYAHITERGEPVTVATNSLTEATRMAKERGGHVTDAMGDLVDDFRVYQETPARPGNGHLVRKAEQVEPAAYGCFGVLCGWAVVFATFATLAGAYLLALHYR